MTNIELPEYTVDNPKGWFIEVNVKFSKIENIDEKTKYNSVLNKVSEKSYSLPEYIQTEILFSLSLTNTDFEAGNFIKLQNILICKPPLLPPPPLKESPTNAGSIIFNTTTNYDDALLTKQCENLGILPSPKIENTIIRRRSFVLYDDLIRVSRHLTLSEQSDLKTENLVKDPIKLQLDISCLSEYDLEEVPTTSSQSNMHLYLGKRKVHAAKQRMVTDFRFFVRAIVRHPDLTTEEASFEFINNEGKGILLEALDRLEEVLRTHSHAYKANYNHIFLNLIDKMTMDPLQVTENVRNIVFNIGPRFWNLRVLQAEIRMNICPPSSTKSSPLRLQLSNESGQYLETHLYKEVLDPVLKTIKFEALQNNGKPGPLHGLPINKARPPYRSEKEYLQLKSFHAKLNGTTYIYDFQEMFQDALNKIWTEYLISRADLQMPEQVMQFTELILDPTNPTSLVEKIRPFGENDCGMVAWQVTFCTPEYPQGRDIIVIGNDITYELGVLGPKEGVVFQKASERAREMRVPQIYLFANYNFAQEIKKHFQFAWKDDANLAKGTEYIYLTPENYKKFSDFVECEEVVEDGETRYKIINFIQNTKGLSLENLKYGGMTVSESLQAYNEIVTITMVTCKTIDFDSFPARLGQRVIQVDNSINRVDNKFLNEKVYTSNEQFNSSQTMHTNGMHTNGIFHARVNNDLEGVSTILCWLSYIPKCRHSGLPILKPLDPIERQVSFNPTSCPYDPRWMLAGRENAQSCIWEEGFFDRGSWNEIMSDWAKTVLTGRARLGGIPVGVIAVETQVVELNNSADLESFDSEAKVVSQASQLCFSDLSYKTAQAIKDFKREDLPLIIFANWPGFLDGAKDMHEEVLKFGVYIADALHEYNQPIIVYMPPFSELGKNAWDVLDVIVNSKYMEMYADPNSQGAVLEPESIVDNFFQPGDLIKKMHCDDSECMRLLKTLNEDLTSANEKKQIKVELHKREAYLMPMYRQGALIFANFYDTPMKMKGCISEHVPWPLSRTFFYWLLKRRLFEKQIKNVIKKVMPNKTDAKASLMISDWFEKHHGQQQSEHFLKKNKLVVEWLETLIEGESLIDLIRSNMST